MPDDDGELRFTLRCISHQATRRNQLSISVQLIQNVFIDRAGCYTRAVHMKRDVIGLVHISCAKHNQQLLRGEGDVDKFVTRDVGAAGAASYLPAMALGIHAIITHEAGREW